VRVHKSGGKVRVHKSVVKVRHTHTHTRTHTHTHTHTHAHTHTHTRAHTHTPHTHTRAQQTHKVNRHTSTLIRTYAPTRACTHARTDGRAHKGGDQTQVGNWVDGKPGPEGTGTVGTWALTNGSKTQFLDKVLYCNILRHARVFASVRVRPTTPFIGSRLSMNPPPPARAAAVSPSPRCPILAVRLVVKGKTHASKDFHDPVGNRRIMWVWGRTASGIQVLLRY
jgi:hypothetical protein